MEDDDEDDDDDGDDRLASCRYICILYVLAVTDEALNEQFEESKTRRFCIALPDSRRNQEEAEREVEEEGRRSLAIGDALVDCFLTVVVAVASS